MNNSFARIAEAYEAAHVDSEYRAALECGDIRRARVIVRKWAKARMPNTKVVGKDGLPKVVYHGTPSNIGFNTFDLSSDNGWKMEHVPTDTAWFTGDRRVASTYYDEGGRILEVYLNLMNPATADAKGQMYKDTEWGYGDLRSGNGFDIDAFAKRAQRAGKDGVIVRSINDTANGMKVVADEYVAFSPNRIKLSNMITCDDDGNIIPLSQRFDIHNDDMRY